jgi:MerR family transcriptional regulator, light-induced transcriptional regulator
MSSAPVVGVRVGELARRVGVAPETLRAWERRYGVLRPARTAAGHRVYGSADVARARRMRELIESGWAAGEAARAVNETAESRAPAAGGASDELLAALLGFDATAGHAAFDRVLGSRSLDTALSDVVLTTVREVGDRWERGEISVAQEHFATDLISGRLRGLGREWGDGLGPSAVLACPPGERHDVGLLCCALALDRRGWRVTYLGADTPVDALEGVVRTVTPSVVVIGSILAQPLHAAAPALSRLSETVPVAVGGGGACADLAAASSAHHLVGDPVSGARELTDAVAALTAAG